MGCYIGTQYDYSMDSSTEDLVTTYEQIQRNRYVLLPPTNTSIVKYIYNDTMPENTSSMNT